MNLGLTNWLALHKLGHYRGIMRLAAKAHVVVFRGRQRFVIS